MTDLKHAFNYLCSIRDSIAASDKFFLFLDYDGTLAHITSKPEDAKPLPRLIRLFEKFNSKKTVINIVSGRDINNLCTLLNSTDISGINLIGSHGSDIIFASSGGQIKQTGNFTSKESEAIRYLKDKVALYSSEIKNSRIEEKPYSFALHYRDTPAKELY